MADVPKEVQQAQPPSERLDQYARQQWEVSCTISQQVL